MKTFQRFLLSLSTLLLMSGVALVAPASARGGNDTVEAATTTTTNDSTTGTQTETEVETHANSLAEQFKLQAKTDLAAKKAQVKLRTQEQRQKSCEARKTNLTTRMANAVTHAQNHKAVFDKIYARAKTFHDTKNLTTANYDTLVANADKAQADAAASITALRQLDVSVDCASQTVADSVSAFQQSVKDTRDSLNTYRKSIVELIKALKGSSTSTDNSAAGDSSTNTPAQ
jgi:hypothetical protein